MRHRRSLSNCDSTTATLGAKILDTLIRLVVFAVFH